MKDFINATTILKNEIEDLDVILSSIDDENYDFIFNDDEKVVLNAINNEKSISGIIDNILINDIDIDNINFKNMVLKILKLRHTLFFSQNLIRKRILN